MHVFILESLCYRTTGWNLIKLGMDEYSRSPYMFEAFWPDLTRGRSRVVKKRYWEIPFKKLLQTGRL